MGWVKIPPPIDTEHTVFADDGDSVWMDDDGYVWADHGSGTWEPILVEGRWITGQRGGYASDIPGATTKIGTRGAKTTVSAGWTPIAKPQLGVPQRGGWSDDVTDGGYNEPNKRGGLADTGDGWMTILMPLEPPSP